jgi:hypothetical protein
MLGEPNYFSKISSHNPHFSATAFSTKLDPKAHICSPTLAFIHDVCKESIPHCSSGDGYAFETRPLTDRDLG